MIILEVVDLLHLNIIALYQEMFLTFNLPSLI